MIRVVLADDQAIVRAGIARILAPADGFEVVAECVDGTEVAAAVARSRPDVVVMDVRMPRRDGLAATREVRALPQPPPVLILTTFDEDEVLWSALEAGAAGFLLKDAGATDLIHAVRAVAGGAAWFDPAVSPRLLAAYRRSVVPDQRQRRRLEELTEREAEVLRWMARGATNAEIAAGLHVSDGTVKSHVGAVFGKLGVRDRAAAIVYAFDHGVVTPGQGPPAS
ncbi:response regulator transcription factor [Occultella aeris]|uniref:Response regulator protein VraR n=1 Tax=Occultella aeris TaxID=2761496 RepID=A0A7M4DHU9_9MICO|nr:response regulator transcription factor [Occultella aeris]VZO36496.1 Response regulator protein VraR [Occultella aeris]